MKTKAIPPEVSSGTFSGILDIIVPEQVGLTGAQRKLIRDSFGDGQDLPSKVRFSCAIAEAVNDTVKDGILIAGTVYMPNPKARAQFGKNKRGHPYLTIGLVDPEGDARYTLTWQGDAVPVQMAVIALKHDQGKRAETIGIPLPLDAAKVHPTGNKDGRRKPDLRRNHDADKNGQPYVRAPRRNHNRLCDDDVKELQRAARRRP
jgi:hypothetical protein